ncbi:MAG: type IV pilus modification PilV family protein [bacterium]
MIVSEKHTRQGNKGFTLLEIMVALAIMAVGLVTVMQLFAGAMRSAKVSYDYSLAVIAAKEVMNRALLPTTVNDFEELEKAGEFENEFLADFRYEIEGPTLYELPEAFVENIEDKSGIFDDLEWQLYQISVRVYWEVGDKEKKVEFTTLKLLKEERGL